MRALPLTDKAAPGGRPRRSRAPSNPFATWLASCGRKPEEVAKELRCSVSAVYNARNGYFQPGLKLAHRIETMTTDKATGVSAVPMTSWQGTKVRRRKGAS